jgi:phosphatidylglycerol:prolipoprotein diacylglycerol transferase
VVLSQPSLILEDPLRLLKFLEGGKGVFGAFIGAGLFGALYLLYRRQPVLAYADAAVPAIALGYAVARIGCFLNGDDFGTVTTLPWAVRFPQGTEAFAHHVAQGWVTAQDWLSLPVHPTQLYHMAVGLLAFLVLSRIRNAPPGTRLAVGLIGYGALRFVIEFVRGDAVPIWHGLDLNQFLCVAMVGIGVLVWVFRPAAAGVGSLREQPV